ncbi:hypothetical protein SUDANB145_00016 [Streptomyces sp. enrichment culture]|uniref:hypothetical protein n=1 Tax=Streptomyces sp. enrichment culture TaxID=1795815 RepID=UPI003F563480
MAALLIPGVAPHGAGAKAAAARFFEGTPVRLRRTTAIAVAAAALLLPSSGHAAPARAAVPGNTLTLTVREVLNALDVEAEDTTAYERNYFRHWIDADRDGCNIRQNFSWRKPSKHPSRASAAG